MRGIKVLSNESKIKSFHEFMSACNIEGNDLLTAEKATDFYDELRGQSVLLDSDVAEIYKVETNVYRLQKRH